MNQTTRSLLLAALAAAPLFPIALKAQNASGGESATQADEGAAADAAKSVSEGELVEMVGYLTAQGGGVASLELDAAGIEALADGLQAGLEGELAVQSMPQAEVQAALQQAQARSEAVQAEAAELPSISMDALRRIGAVMVMQSGLNQLGFGAGDAAAIRRGFVKGASESEPDPKMQAKMSAFQSFIQKRVGTAQAKAQAAAAEAAEGNIAEGEAFFAELDEKSGIEKADSGLYYSIEDPGGAKKPSMEDSVLVHYEGTLIDGTKFDSSYDRGEPAEFPLNGVVTGFGEGLTKIGEGGEITLYIPSELGYGNNPRPGGAIEPGDTLIFKCELIEINPGKGGDSEG